MNSSMGSIDK